jgi:hypothetical protein
MREAIQVRTPHADRPVHTQAFTSSSTAAVLTGVSTECGSTDGAWYTFVPSEDCHIIFGESTVAAASTSQMFFAAGVEFTRWLSRTKDAYLRVIRNSTDGTLYWHKSEG